MSEHDALPGPPAPADPNAAGAGTGHGHGMSVARLEAFSDGVFAIVITLLVLDLPGPPKAGSYTKTLGHHWATYVAYLASFFVIGTIWLNHHATFRLVQRTTYRLQVFNLLLLLPISILPWPTELLASAAQHGTTADHQVTVIIYGATMTVFSGIFNALWHYILRHRELHQPWVTPQMLELRTRRYNLGLPVYPLVTVIGWFNVPAFLVLNLLLAVVYLLPTPDTDG
jgi:uncharacterized membrane protein